jgi:competence protein ComEA
MEATSWWRSPRLLAAALCLLLGAAMLVAGLIPRLAGTLPPPPADAALADLAEPAPEWPDEAPPELVVYVTGAVRAPDVYRLPPGARVKDAVLAAGGLRHEAAVAQVNLAEPLSDAQHVHIPALGEGAENEPGSGPVAGAEAGLLDLNRASTADLEELPGVGQTIAERIVARRDAEGPFGSVEELREVTGIGSKLYEQIAPLVTAGR